MKLLLIILDNRACWFRQENGLWSQPFEEPVGTPDVRGHSVSQCPWLVKSGVPVGMHVELVLDSGFLDVELRRLTPESSKLASWLDCRAVRRRALREQPDVSVNRVCLPSRRTAISIVQTLPQPDLQAWLLGLRGVMFTSVRSMGNLLAGRIDSRARRRGNACLYVLHEAGVCRHLLYLSGQLCFARLVPGRDTAADLSSVRDTLGHLLAIGVETRGLVLHTLGLSVDAQQRLAGESGCAGQISLDSPVDHAPARSLAEWVASLTPAHRSVIPGVSRMRMALLASSGRLPSGVSPVSGDLPVSAAAPLSCESMSRAEMSFSTLLLSWQVLLQHVRRLGLSVAGVLMLSIALWLTGVEIFDRRQEDVANRASVRLLRQQIAGLREQATRLHASPVAAERALLRRQAFAVASSGEPGQWLGLLAGAITAHAPIVIDTLEWSRQAQPEVDVDALLPEPARLSGAFDRSGHRRSRMPVDGEPDDRLVVALQGHLEAGMPLREQQDQLAAFKTTLESLHGAAAVRIDHSPIDDYAGGRWPLSGEVQRAAAGKSEFRLLLQLQSGEVKPAASLARSSRPAT